MTDFRRARLSTYAAWTLAVSGITFLLGFGLLAWADGGVTFFVVLRVWLVFALGVGGGALLVLLLPAAGAGSLARVLLAFVVLLAILWLQRPMRGIANGAVGPLSDLWSKIGGWLSGGLGYFDTVSWRVSLVGGVVILLVYPFLRLLLTPGMSLAGRLLDKLWRQWRAVNSDHEAETQASRGVEEFFANLAVRHFMLFVSAISVSLVILLPPILLAVDAAGLYGSSKGIFDAGEHIVWVGSLVLVLELTALTLRDALPTRSAQPAQDRARASGRPPRVDDLYRRLTELAGDHIVYAEARPARNAPPAERPHTSEPRNEGPSAVVFANLRASPALTEAKIDQLRPVLDRFLDPAASAPRISISESLTSDHYLILAGLVRHALDNGGAVLVIVPDELMLEVRKSFEQALAERALTFAVSLFEATVNPPPGDELFNLVLIAESIFESGFLRFADNYESVLARASLIFLIEAADMDLGWLRLRLFSLWQLIEHDRARLVIQSSSSQDLDSIVSLVAQQGGRGAAEPISLTRSSQRATHILVLDDCLGLQQQLQSRLFPGLHNPLPAALTLAFEAARFDCEPIVYNSMLDPLDATQVENGWGNGVVTLARNDTAWSALDNAEYALGRLRTDRFRAHMSPTDQPATVLGWDTANFLSMRERNYNFFQANAFLVQILSKNYPMRKFLRDFEEQAYDPQAQQHQIFLPQVPRLAGGVAELVYLVTHAMLRKRGLTRTQFKHILETIPDRRFVDNAGIGNDRSGLKVLLRLYDADGRAQIVQEPHALTGDKVFRLVTSGGPWDEFDSVRVTQQGAPVAGSPLDYSDRGLTFAPGTQVKAGNRILQVATVDRQEINLDAVGPDGWGILPNVTFVNRYRFKLTVDPVIEHTSEVMRFGGEIATALLHMSYRRQTEGMYVYPGGVEPFASSTPRELRRLGNEPWSLVERNRKCVAHIVMTRLLNAVPIGSRIAASGAPTQEIIPDALRSVTVALAICVVLKDTIASLFPEAAPRIAVLSPQLSQLDERLEQVMQDPTTAGAAVERDSDALRAEIELARFLAARAGYYDGCDDSDGSNRSVFETWASEALRQRFAARDDVIELFIVEDSDRDLGVARAIARDTETFRAAAYFADYLAGNERAPGGQGTYLRFGAQKLTRFLYVSGARALLRRLGNVVDLPGKGAVP